jgi:hypothetical protein
MSWFFQLSRYTWRGDLGAGVSLGTPQSCEHGACTMEVKQTAAVGGDMLAVVAAETEKGTELVKSSAGPLGRIEASHTSDLAFDAPVILLQSIVSISAGPMVHMPVEC